MPVYARSVYFIVYRPTWFTDNTLSAGLRKHCIVLCLASEGIAYITNCEDFFKCTHEKKYQELDNM